MSGILAGRGYLLVCALVGFICAYFLNAYIVIVLAAVAVILILLFLKGPHQAEGGLAALFLAGLLASFLVGLVIGSLPYVPWANLWEYVSRLEIRKFFKDYILR